MAIRLVQLIHPQRGRRMAVVEEPNLRMLADVTSVYGLAERAAGGSKKIEKLIEQIGVDETLPYDPIYRGESEWALLPAFDHPIEASRCFITGTGLTHKASVEARQSMHGDAAVETDSMKMYRIGLEGGRPKRGKIGASPEWFYKGIGTILQRPGEALQVPWHGDDGGEEAEIAGCYIIAADGQPLRIGLVQGNEFSDHVMESKNYLYLAQSKLRSCSIGPEILIGTDLSEEVRGHATIERAGKTVWAGPLASGEPHMSHTLANLEHHHFKHVEHRRPGDAHIHFFGADRFSYKDKLKLEENDVMTIAFIGLGRALRNPLHIDTSEPKLVKAAPL